MKKLVAAICLTGSALALSACAGEGNVDTAPPYEMGRTATHAEAPVASPVYVKPAEKVFQAAQTK